MKLIGNVSVLEITTVQICLTLYCKSECSSTFINYIGDIQIEHIRMTDIFLIFWNAVFKPGSFIRHDLDAVEVVDGIQYLYRWRERVRCIG